MKSAILKTKFSQNPINDVVVVIAVVGVDDDDEAGENEVFIDNSIKEMRQEKPKGNICMYLFCIMFVYVCVYVGRKRIPLRINIHILSAHVV